MAKTDHIKRAQETAIALRRASITGDTSKLDEIPVGELLAEIAALQALNPVEGIEHDARRPAKPTAQQEYLPGAVYQRDTAADPLNRLVPGGTYQTAEGTTPEWLSTAVLEYIYHRTARERSNRALKQRQAAEHHRWLMEPRSKAQGPARHEMGRARGEYIRALQELANGAEYADPYITAGEALGQAGGLLQVTQEACNARYLPPDFRVNGLQSRRKRKRKKHRGGRRHNAIRVKVY